jgi:hypothetical protein
MGSNGVQAVSVGGIAQQGDHGKGTHSREVLLADRIAALPANALPAVSAYRLPARAHLLDRVDDRNQEQASHPNSQFKDSDVSVKHRTSPMGKMDAAPPK